jgi:hypothetical protein
MDYLPYLQLELNDHFPTHFIDVRREMTDKGEFDRVYIDNKETKYGVYPNLMNGVMFEYNIEPKQIATDIALRLKRVIESERSL